MTNDKEDHKTSRIALLRAALRERTGNAVLDDLSHASILAGVVGDDPELKAVFKEEMSREEAAERAERAASILQERQARQMSAMVERAREKRLATRSEEESHD